MSTRTTKAAAHSCLHALEPHDHACLIYEDPGARVAATVALATDAVDRHERFLYLSNDHMRRETVAGLRSSRVSPELLDPGQLVFVTERAPFCMDGLFTADAMIAFIAEEMRQATADGFAGLRAAIEMTWILGNELETMRVLECESRLNEIMPSVSAAVVCQWDRTAFEPMIVLEALRTHPLVAEGDALLDNTAYYVPTSEYLAFRSAEEQLDRQLGVLRALDTSRRGAFGADTQAVPTAS